MGSDRDAVYMKMALAEARKGLGRTAPNPCVGAVVVKNDRVVGKGWHRRAGTPHAEIHALRAAGAEAAGATIYVTLEPCNHHGRTPPCSEAIIAAGIKRVVFALADPNPEAGGGAGRLARAGIEVAGGVLADESGKLNRPFIKRITTGLPWVLLKAAVSLDGRIAAAGGHSQWITGEQSRRLAHRLRAENDAILVGVGTVLADDPALTARLPGRPGRDPVRVVLDSRLQTPPTARVINRVSAAETWIFCAGDADPAKAEVLRTAGARIVPVARAKAALAGVRQGFDNRGAVGLALRPVLVELGKAGIASLLVEGGGRVHGSFLDQALADEAAFFVAPLLIGGDGLPAIGPLGLRRVDQAHRLREVTTRRLGNDILIRGLL